MDEVKYLSNEEIFNELKDKISLCPMIILRSRIQEFLDELKERIDKLWKHDDLVTITTTEYENLLKQKKKCKSHVWTRNSDESYTCERCGEWWEHDR